MKVLLRAALALAVGLSAAGCGSGGGLTGNIADGLDGPEGGQAEGAGEGLEAEALADQVELPDGAEVPFDLGPDAWVELDGGTGGKLGDPCVNLVDCKSFLCLAMDGGGVCTEQCFGDCPEGWACQMTTLFGPDPMTVCLPIEFDSCVECTDHKECGSGEGFCVEVAEGEGKACLFPCSAAKGCAAAFSCGGVDVGGGQAVDLCIPVTASCTCLPGSDGDERECTRENEYGICIGQEACDGEQGWSECDAAFPGQEVCDGKDNNCNGQVDEGAGDLDADGQADCVDDDDDGDGDGDGTDCKPLDPAIHHGAEELCDGIDNDCDGEVDETAGDTDGDGLADCVDDDDDGDGVPDAADNCPLVYNKKQSDIDEDGDGDLCDPDDDGDGVPDELDNCPADPNASQDDLDSDGLGDACDEDQDGDGWENGGDCSPKDPDTHPLAVEQCDGKDNNCNSMIDEGYKDTDADGLADCVDHDDDGDGDPDETDCQPLNPAVGAGLPELCDGIDNDCNGKVDEASGDLDGDGLADCVDPDDDNDGSPDVEDCAAANPAVSPLSTEKCNSIDDDCDKLVDEEGAAGCAIWYFDADGDQYGKSAAGKCLCAPDGYYTATEKGDCNDYDGAINPSAAELCDGKDNNCNAQVDEGFQDLDKNGIADCVDSDDDGDGVIDFSDNCPALANPGQTDSDGDGKGNECDPDDDNDLTPDEADCEPLNAAIHPGAAEACNGKDDDCDGQVDPEGSAGCKTYFPDVDKDGYGTSQEGKCLCKAAPPYSALVSGDCDDAAAAVNPAAKEVCDGKDNDCDGTDDEGFLDSDKDWLADCVDADDDNDDEFDIDDNCPLVPNPSQLDLDKDGVGNACDPDDDGDGVPDELDCAPLDPKSFPDAPETCDFKDNDCDGQVDEAGAAGCQNLYLDWDQDGYGLSGQSKCLCAEQGAYTAAGGGDCNDNDPMAHPGMNEVCDGKDNDCDAAVDNGFPDLDADGKADCVDLDDDGDGSLDGDDCKPTDPAVHPGATEACNGKDDDCDNLTDEEDATGCKAWYKDYDADEFGKNGTSKCLCAAAGYYTAAVDGDCNDLDPAVSPAAPEECDNVDNNCDGLVDGVCGVAQTGWPLFKYDIRRTGHNMTVQGPGQANLKWKYATGAALLGSPVVAGDGTVFVATGTSLHALSAGNGALKWKLDLGGAVSGRSGPAIRKDGTLVIPAGKKLFLVSADGKVLSQADVGGLVPSNPVIDTKGRIYIVSESALFSFGPDLSVNWTFSVPNSLLSPGHVAIGSGNRLHFSTSSHTVYAVNPDGTVYWTYSYNLADTDGSCAIGEDGRVYQSFSNYVVSISPQGQFIWAVNVQGDIDADVSIFNTGFQCCNPVDYVIANPNGATGLWSIHYNGSVAFHVSPYAKDGSWNSVPVMDMDGDIYVGSDVGKFYSVTSGGTLRWSFTTQDQHIRGAAAIASGVVYFGDDAGVVYAVGN